jgi:hypothetical protein
MSKNILLLLLSVLFINTIWAQKPSKRIEITGTVLNVYNGPIADAVILIDNQSTQFTTNSRGKYRIKVKPTAIKIGVVTFGNGSFEDSIKGRTHIDFNLGKISASKIPEQPTSPGELSSIKSSREFKSSEFSNYVSRDYGGIIVIKTRVKND